MQEENQLYGGGVNAACGTAGMASQQAQCATDGYAEQRRAPEPTIQAVIEVRATRNFADALMAAMSGSRIVRRGWNASGQWVTAQWPDKGSKMSQPYLYLKNAQNELVPWVPSQGDLFANDWAILPTR